MQTKFLHYPGYISDLFIIFTLNFNKNSWPNNFANFNKINEDMEFFNNILKEFGGIPDDLFIFFYQKEEKQSFVSDYFLSNFNEEMLQKLNFETIKKEIININDLNEKLFKFFFPEDNLIFDNNNCDIIDIISNKVGSSEYTDIVKYRLLSFFINPKKHTQMLIDELVKKELLLSKYYEKNYRLIIDTQENFNFEEFEKDLSKINLEKINLENVNTIFVSINMIAKNKISTQFFPNSIYCQIGYDYKDSIEYLLNRKSLPNIDMFGKIMNDKNRLEILEMLMKNREMTTTEIAKNLNLSVNASFYHLDMMLNVEMLFTRNEGRTVFYQINKQYFRNMSQAILKYVERKE
ncbi:MAG: ArsR/SmtB family transcription factor [Saccharofermentanales bacterium]